MSVIDWFLPAGPPPDAATLERRRVLIQGSLAASAVTVGFLANRFWVEPEFGPGHVNMLVSFFFMLSCPFVVKLTGRHEPAAHTLLVAMTGTVLLDAWLFGGLHSVGIIATMVVPLMATFFLGRQVGAAYTAVLLVGMVLQYVRQDAAGPLPPPAQLDIMRLAALGGILLFIQVFASIYEREREATAVRLAAITDSARDGILAVDGTGTVCVANPAAERLLDIHGAVGRPYADVVPGPLAELIYRTQSSGMLGETDLDLAGGRFGTAAANPMLRNGEQRGTVVTLRDRTIEREVDEMKTVFISTVSHELRTPMTSVLGFAKLIRSKLDSTVFPALPEDARRAHKAAPRIAQNLDIIVAEGERLTAMINDLLDITKMESGHMEWSMAPAEPAAIAQRALDAAGGLFEDSEVALRGDFDRPLPTVAIDESRILQVLLNFISNAAKFTEQGTVTLRVRRDVDRLRFEVEDTGPGIPADECEAVFDRFRQASANAGTKGTGLGLAICGEIAAAHGGRVGVDSTVGVGSTFWLELPVRD